MERKVFLKKNQSKKSVNSTTFLSDDLDRKERMLQGSNILGDFSLFEQYNVERDNCNKFRMIFVVNPICTNVLHNNRTEIVQNEGSENVIVLRDDSTYTKNDILGGDNCIQNTSTINREQAIKDTEYSHPKNGGFVYHCGTDIFNNHMLRSNGFVHVNKMNGTSSAKCSSVYNTISDYLRDGEGYIVKSVVNPNKDDSNGMTELHLYMNDTTSTLKRAYINKIKEKDGWVGFINPGNIDIPNSNNTGVTINRMLAYEKPCSFIDMYPDRSLYSFIPKYNYYRKRLEPNWDYCITYPYAKDIDVVNKVCGGKAGMMRADVTTGMSSSSIQMLNCRSLFKHTLKQNDTISVYYKSGSEFKKIAAPIRVYTVGNGDGSETDRVFSIRVADVSNYSSQILSGGLFFKKLSGGVECEYYARKYKKIKINGHDLRSDVNKVAYGINIYGDKEAQIVFTDDIDVEGLYDHLGRPVSELYFTVVKRNAGHKEWEMEQYSASTVEYSHCFGKVTAGFDFGPSSATQMDYNIRYLHNINAQLVGTTCGNADRVLGKTIVNGIPKTVGPASGITIDDDVFFGNVVEFDPTNYEEREISPVLFRFNTLQRELIQGTEAKISYDKFIHDDYDLNSIGDSETFEVEPTSFNTSKFDGETINIMGNICPEGYFYNPHTKIKIRESAEEVTNIRAKLVNYLYIDGRLSGGDTIIRIKAPTNYNFLKNDVIAFCDAGDIDRTQTVVWGYIDEVSGNNLTIKFEGRPFANFSYIDSGSSERRFKAYYCIEAVPLYAAFNSKTQTFTWRGITAPSEMNQEMELFDTPFSNGRFYIEKNITFFLRRQDPYGDFGLLWGKFDESRHPKNPMEYFRLEGTMLDLSQIYNFYNNLDNVCY